MEEENLLAPYEKQFDIATRKRMVAEMIGELRKAKGLQQKEVAEILGISPQTYNGYEKGRNEPPIEMLVRLSFLYEVPLNLIVQRDRLHSYDQSAMESVRSLEQMMATMRSDLEGTKFRENNQLQTLINTMELLIEVNKEVIEKTKL